MNQMLMFFIHHISRNPKKIKFDYKLNLLGKFIKSYRQSCERTGSRKSLKVFL